MSEWFFSSRSSKHLQNIKTPKPLELKSWIFERMFTPHHLSYVMCHMSCVTCQVPPVTCQLSCVTSHVLPVFFLFFFSKSFIEIIFKKGKTKKKEQRCESSKGGSVINGAYPSSVHRHMKPSSEINNIYIYNIG